MFHALAFILALRRFSFVQTSSVCLRLLQYVITFKQANAYAHSQTRARRRAQPLKITIHQLLHYCCLRQCYRVPFRLVIDRSFSSDFDGFSYLPKHIVSVVKLTPVTFITQSGTTHCHNGVSVRFQEKRHFRSFCTFVGILKGLEVFFFYIEGGNYFFNFGKCNWQKIKTVEFLWVQVGKW